MLLVALLIILLALTPSIASLWVIPQADARAQARLRMAAEAVARRQLAAMRLSPDHQYVDGIGYVIGDFTCQFNARSNYLRCAVNPSGPCQDCSHYFAKPLNLD